MWSVHQFKWTIKRILGQVPESLISVLAKSEIVDHLGGNTSSLESNRSLAAAIASCNFRSSCAAARNDRKNNILASQRF
jgi:uncharacterized protein YbcI